MTALEALLLGVVQGVFMFVPVSSTSHLALTQAVLRDRGSALPPPDAPEMILFDIVAHVGTLLSIVVVMHDPLRRLAAGLLADARRLVRSRPVGSSLTDDADEGAAGVPYLRLLGLGLITVAVTGVIGLVVRAVGTGIFAEPMLIAVALLVTGGILWWTDSASKLWRDAGHVTVGVAIAIGLAQGAALLPGLSRSGLTIAMALAVGLHRHVAAQYSFFVAVPTILAAALLQTLDVARDPAAAFTFGWSSYAIGFAVAAVVGAVALAVVLRLLYRARFRAFAVYVWLLGGSVLLGGLPVG